MRAALASELALCADGTLYTVHNAASGYLLPIGGFRIKKASQYASQANFNPTWYLAYLTVQAAQISGHQFALKATEPQFDPAVIANTTVFIWEDADIKELQRLLRAATATSSDPEINSLDANYNFLAPGLKLDTRTGRGEYNRHPFKLSPMQVNLLLVLSQATHTAMSCEELVARVGPDASNPQQAIKSLVNRTLKAMGSKLGDSLCPILEIKSRYRSVSNTYRWVGNLPRMS